MKDNVRQRFYNAVKWAKCHPGMSIGIFVISGLIWLVSFDRNDAFFTYDGVTLGMTTEQVMQVLPESGEFEKIRGRQNSNDPAEYEILVVKEVPAPWEGMLIGAENNEVVGFSMLILKFSQEKLDQLRLDLIFRYGSPDDVIKSKYGGKTLIWGKVKIGEDFLQKATSIDSAAIIYREFRNGRASIRITRDGKGPKLS